MTFKVRYRRIYVEVLGKKGTTCECCNKKPKPRGINTHHWSYAYKTKEVRENPELALKNTSLLCFTDHRIADALRVVLDNPEKVKKLMKLRERAIKK